MREIQDTLLSLQGKHVPRARSNEAHRTVYKSKEVTCDQVGQGFHPGDEGTVETSFSGQSSPELDPSCPLPEASK